MEKKEKISVVEMLIAITIAVMTILTAGNVIARKLFMSSFSFVEEITIILFILSTLLGTAVAVKRNGHMGFSGLTDIMKPKVAHIIGIIGDLICLIFFLLVLYYGIIMVIGQHKLNMTTPALGFPEWIYGSSIPIGALCISIAYIKKIITSIKKGGK